MSYSRHVVFVLFLGAAAPWLAACSSAPVLISGSPKAAPSRLPSPSFVEGDRKVFSTWATGSRSAEEAYRLAFGNAIGQAAKELGVIVEGEVECVEKSTEDSYTYTCRSKEKTKQIPIKLKKVKVRQHYEECWKVAGEIRCDGYVRISIPEAELKLAARMIRGRTALVWECAGPEGYSCPSNLEEEVRSAADRGGLPLLSVAVEEGDCADLAEKLDAAYLFKVRFSLNIAGKEGKATFARGSASAQLVETRDCKVKRTVDTGEMKGGGYSRDDALRLTLKDICTRLVGRIEAAGFDEVLRGGEE